MENSKKMNILQILVATLMVLFSWNSFGWIGIKGNFIENETLALEDLPSSHYNIGFLTFELTEYNRHCSVVLWKNFAILNPKMCTGEIGNLQGAKSILNSPYKSYVQPVVINEETKLGAKLHIKKIHYMTDIDKRIEDMAYLFLELDGQPLSIATSEIDTLNNHKFPVDTSYIYGTTIVRQDNQNPIQSNCKMAKTYGDTLSEIYCEKMDNILNSPSPILFNKNGNPVGLINSNVLYKNDYSLAMSFKFLINDKQLGLYGDKTKILINQNFPSDFPVYLASNCPDSSDLDIKVKLPHIPFPTHLKTKGSKTVYLGNFKPDSVLKIKVKSSTGKEWIDQGDPESFISLKSEKHEGMAYQKIAITDCQ